MSCTKLKPLILLDIFKSQTDEEHRLNVPQLLDELARRNVSAERKGIYRDIAALCEYGADIRKSGSGYYLAARDMTVQELRAVAAAVSAAEFISQKKTDELMEKLGRLASVHQARRIAGTLTARKCETNAQLNNLERVEAAIDQRRQLIYVPAGQAEEGATWRRISPYAVRCEAGRCYVVCNEEERQGISRIRLDKMDRVRLDNTPWRHFSEVTGSKTEFSAALTGGEKTRVSLLCAQNSLEEALCRLPDAKVYKEGRERYLLIAEAVPNEEFLRWTACMAGYIELAAPESLRDLLAARLRAALSLYD